MDIVQELLNEAFMNNVPVYTFGIGNNVQEDVLKKMSSPPHEVNNYLLRWIIFNLKTNKFCSKDVS